MWKGAQFLTVTYLMLKSFIVYFTVGFIVLCLIVSYNQRNSEMVFVKAGDGNEYTVRNLPDKQVAADTLAELRRRMELLVQEMSSNPDVQDEFCSLQIEQLKDRFKPDKICESPSDSKYTSYSVDKGAKIFVCLRNKQTGEIADINTLTYVSIHELSHVMSSEVGHTDQFWSNFKSLLRQAMALNIYTYVDYSKSPMPYCGISINSSAIDPATDNLQATLKTTNTTRSCR